METIEIGQVLEGDQFLGFAEVLQNMLKVVFPCLEKRKWIRVVRKHFQRLNNAANITNLTAY